MNYDFKDNSEFHVWDLGADQLRSPMEYFKTSWMSRVIQTGDRVLDIGCGPGYAVQVLQEIGYEVLGVDLNSELVGLARSRGINVVEEDALDAVRKRISDFDVFCMSDFIEHVPLSLMVEIFKEIAKHPGKKIYLCTPNLDSLLGIKFWFHMPTHVNPMHPLVIRKMLSKLKYSILDEWTEYGGLRKNNWKNGLRKWFLQKLFGPEQSRFFYGGANICFIAKSL